MAQMLGQTAAPQGANNLGGTSADQFDILRRRAKQQALQQNQQQSEALKRRFASIGGLNSGAYIKQQQIANEQANQNAEQAQQNVDLAQAQENQRQRDILQAQGFQSGEAQKQREFVTSERLGGQQFQTQSLGQQQRFASTEADKQRQFQKALADREFQATMAQNYFNNQATILNLATALGFDPKEWRHGGDSSQSQKAFFDKLSQTAPFLSGLGFDAKGNPVIS